MNAYIVTEGAQDKELLDLLLPADLEHDVAVVAAGGGSGAVSMARTLLVRKHVPVALVVDADSISPELARERSLTLRELLRNVSVGDPAEVFLAIPEMEGIFFQKPRVLERALGVKIPETLAIRAEARPKESLGKLFASHPNITGMSQLLAALTPNDIEDLRQSHPIAEINHFLRQALRTTIAGAA